ncbi:MAG: DUF1801 domain-containing protein [Chloroflexota bacterium]
MIPIHEIETILQRTPEHLKEIVFELRNVIAAAAPDASEGLRWGDLCYFHAGRGGIVSAGICQIEVRDGFVRLAFIHGAFLPDPKHLLEGNQKSKRYVRIHSYDDAPWADLSALIKAAAQFDPYSLAQ